MVIAQGVVVLGCFVTPVNDLACLETRPRHPRQRSHSLGSLQQVRHEPRLPVFPRRSSSASAAPTRRSGRQPVGILRAGERTPTVGRAPAPGRTYAHRPLRGRGWVKRVPPQQQSRGPRWQQRLTGEIQRADRGSPVRCERKLIVSFQPITEDRKPGPFRRVMMERFCPVYSGARPGPTSTRKQRAFRSRPFVLDSRRYLPPGKQSLPFP